MEKVKVRISETIASLDKVKSYQLEGSNNPLLKAQAAYGVDKHEDMQDSCDAKEITIKEAYCKNPNPKRKDCRLDCMKGCTVIEIKPEGQEEMGERQVSAYSTALKKMYTEKGADMFQEGRMSYFQKCLSEDKASLDLRMKVDTYNFCTGITPDKLVGEVPRSNVAAEALGD